MKNVSHDGGNNVVHDTQISNGEQPNGLTELWEFLKSIFGGSGNGGTKSAGSATPNQSTEAHVTEFNRSLGSDLANTKGTLGAETPGKPNGIPGGVGGGSGVNADNLVTVNRDGALSERKSRGNDILHAGKMREDGSVYFSKPEEAFGYMISVQKSGKEAFGVVFDKGVLVLPIQNNLIDKCTPELSGYSITDGVLNDPLNEFDKKIITAVHTHPNDAEPSVTGDGDIEYVKIHNPGNYWFVLGIGDNQIFTFIKQSNWERGRVGNISKDNSLFVSDLIQKSGVIKLINVYKRMIKTK